MEETLDLFAGFTEKEIGLMKFHYSYSESARETMSRSAKLRWARMSEEEKQTCLEKSFHSGEARAKSGDSMRKFWAGKTPEAIKAHVESSFLSPEAKAKSKVGYRKFIANLTEEERKEYHRYRLERMRAFWTGPEGEAKREEMALIVSRIWAGKTLEERRRWIADSCQSPEAKKNRLLFWANLPDEERRQFGLRVIDAKIERGTLAAGKFPSMEEYFLGMYLEKLYPGVFEYNGSGTDRKVIGRRIPDFISRNGENIVVEMFGSYFHTEEEVGERLRHYEKYGYRCVVIWEYENVESVVKGKLDNVMTSELSGGKYIGVRSLTEGGD